MWAVSGNSPFTLKRRFHLRMWDNSVNSLVFFFPPSDHKPLNACSEVSWCEPKVEQGAALPFPPQPWPGTETGHEVLNLRFEKVPESSSSLSVALRNVWAMPLLVQCLEPVNYLPHLASWDQDGTTGNPKKNPQTPKQQHTLGQESFLFAMAKLAPQTR